LNLCQLQAGALPPEWGRKLPREIPGLKLGRLAVAKEWQRQGLGRTLLVARWRRCSRAWFCRRKTGFIRE